MEYLNKAETVRNDLPALMMAGQRLVLFNRFCRVLMRKPEAVCKDE